MRRIITKPLLTIGVSTLLFAGCSNDMTDIYEKNQKELQAQADKLVEQCNNFKEIEVNLTSNVDGMFCGVYTQNPYDENGGLAGTPILQGLTPISTALTISKGVDKLYILSSKGLLTRTVGDLNENLSTATRAMTDNTISEGLDNAINRAFPENKYNLANQDLYFNTDLQLKDKANIKLTYVSDGGSNIEGLLYLYTYPASTTAPTLDQCTFYGIDQNTGEVVKLDGAPVMPTVIENKNIYKRPLDVNNYIFSNVEERASGKHRQADMGEFGIDIKIGFVFVGIFDVSEIDPATGRSISCYKNHYSFTTPSLNDQTHSLNKKARNDGTFTYTQPCSQGCIKKITYEGKNYFVLGMENSMPDGISYDADFNDMLCVLEVTPDNGFIPGGGPTGPDLETFMYTRGYYLFEDNYPNQGDYDFNDVVIQYEIKTFVNRAAFKDDYNEVKVALLAHGCNFANEFGFHVGDKDDTDEGTFYPVFKSIQGYANVSGEVDPSKFKYSETLHFPGRITGTKGSGAKIRPYLKNQNGVIYDNSFSRNGQEYPYVLDIPLESTTYNYTLNFNYTVEKEAGKGFRWCQEGKRLDAAYKETPKTERWYLKGYKDESLLIKREADPNDNYVVE